MELLNCSLLCELGGLGARIPTPTHSTCVLPAAPVSASVSGTHTMNRILRGMALTALCLALAGRPAANAAEVFDGRFFRGEGDVEYLQLLDISRRMFADDPEFQNVAMLYQPSWNGFVEGPTWGAWWVQNSYGTTYCALPFYEEPFVTFLQNAQDLWFDQMGDGKTSYVWNNKDSWVPPDGCLMDCANPTWAMHKQGDGRVAIHDWGMEFTAAGALLQTELLLISRDPAAIERYRPKLERCAAFIESRRDPTNNLFLAGAAGNLLAPSYAGGKKPDGSYGLAYLTGLSVTYIAFLDRLIELERLAGREAQATLYLNHRATARQGLDQLATDEGYFIKYQDPDGTRHGVYGAPKHGYFEASPNHDAICFRVVDEAQSGRIYRKMAGIAGLRPHGLIIANCPSLDDMYEAPEGLWGFGTWVNGGHWTTCEARMIMAYHRVGQYEDARRAMKQMLTFARQFRMDNPLVKFGSEVYQPREPVNITYDAFGAPAAMIRGLFEYLYRADGLTLVPHIPPGITRLEQKFPIRFGNKRLYLAVTGQGPITAVRVDDQAWPTFDAQSVFLPYASTPDLAAVQVIRGQAAPLSFTAPQPDDSTPTVPGWEAWPAPIPATPVSPDAPDGGKVVAGNATTPAPEPGVLLARTGRVRRFHEAMAGAGLAGTHEAAHARLVVRCLATAHRRAELLATGKLDRLPGPSQAAADKLYLDTVARLYDGLEKALNDYAGANEPLRRRIHDLWRTSGS